MVWSHIILLPSQWNEVKPVGQSEKVRNQYENSEVWRWQDESPHTVYCFSNTLIRPLNNVWIHRGISTGLHLVLFDLTKTPLRIETSFDGLINVLLEYWLYSVWAHILWSFGTSTFKKDMTFVLWRLVGSHAKYTQVFVNGQNMQNHS